MSLRVTYHAVMRFLERHGDERPLDEQRAELERLAGSARATKRKTLRGEEIWSSEHVDFVVKRDRGRPTNTSLVAVTVLPAPRPSASEIALAEREAWEAENEERKASGQ